MDCFVASAPRNDVTELFDIESEANRHVHVRAIVAGSNTVTFDARQ
jgi:hypothetical protein